MKEHAIHGVPGPGRAGPNRLWIIWILSSFSCHLFAQLNGPYLLSFSTLSPSVFDPSCAPDSSSFVSRAFLSLLQKFGLRFPWRIRGPWGTVPGLPSRRNLSSRRGTPGRLLRVPSPRRMPVEAVEEARSRKGSRWWEFTGIYKPAMNNIIMNIINSVMNNEFILMMNKNDDNKWWVIMVIINE